MDTVVCSGSELFSRSRWGAVPSPVLFDEGHYIRSYSSRSVWFDLETRSGLEPRFPVDPVVEWQVVLDLPDSATRRLKSSVAEVIGFPAPSDKKDRNRIAHQMIWNIEHPFTRQQRQLFWLTDWWDIEQRIIDWYVDSSLDQMGYGKSTVVNMLTQAMHPGKLAGSELKYLIERNKRDYGDNQSGGLYRASAGYGLGRSWVQRDIRRTRRGRASERR